MATIIYGPVTHIQKHDAVRPTLRKKVLCGENIHCFSVASTTSTHLVIKRRAAWDKYSS
ncbi:unnamed protein product [Gulo gulo]|uniref:Uncharacterized protein n=1 Tax=Gulo gulo TaxID=48420 RepID=A0A9X9M107_GULGU|nr:unnamed protein product [Gulo gulo]